ncbi:AK3 (predicted) [Pycnogonum litorale]
MASKIIKAIILGPPGSGKGTISSRIARDFGLKHLASGDVFRSQIREKTELGLEAAKYVEKGHLVPDDITVKLMINELNKKYKEACWILDGFPRTVPQAEKLCQGQKVNMVLNLCVPDEEIIERIRHRWIHEPSGRVYHMKFSPPKNNGFDDVSGEKLIQRDDDRPDTVKDRLKHYKELTLPLMEFYSKAGLLQEFHGRESNEIWPRMHKYISSHIPALSGPF